MEFFTRVLAGNGRLKERAREAEQVNQVFKENLDNLKGLLESEESNVVLALLDMVYESSFPEEQVFMKTPSRARLKSKKELVVRLLIGLDSLGVPAMAEMLVFIKKHGPEAVADSLVTLLEFMSPLLEGKEAPEFSTDDVVDAMDFEWHSTSRTGSPLLNVIASVTSSPRASTASVGDSPLHPIISASPYRRAFSDRSMLVSRANELSAKLVLDKTSTAPTAPQPTLTMSASLQYPSAYRDFRSGEPTILETPASPEITQVSTVEKPSSYSLDTLPERRHRRKSSSLRELIVEDTIELSGEGSVGASSKRHSSSSSWRQNSSEFTLIITNTSETSSPMNPGLVAGDSRVGVTVPPDKTFLSSIYTQDRHVNWSGRKAHRISPSPPHDKVALWREDAGGFSVDLVSSDKNAAQASEHEIPMTLLDLEAEVCPTGMDDDALKPHENDEHKLRLRSHIRDGDVEENARHAQSSRDHEEDARRALLSLYDYDQDAAHAHSLDTHEDDAGHAHTCVQPSLNNHMEDVHSSYDFDEEAVHEEDAVHAHTHEKDARHTCSSDTLEESAGYTHMFGLEEGGCETISDKITPEGSSQEDYGFQGILAPLLLPSSTNVSQDVNYKAGDISSFSEASLKEILQSEDGRSLKQEALEMKDEYTSHGKEVNLHTSSLDEVINSSLDTDSVNHSLNESIKLEMPEPMREDEKREDAQPLDVHVDNVSSPCALAEHLKVNDDQFEKLFSGLDSTEEDVLREGGELPLIQRGRMGIQDDKMVEHNQEKDSASGLNKEKMHSHDEKMGLRDENTLSKEYSEKEFLDNPGQFIMGAGESTPFLHVYPVESHVVASTKECGGSKEASMVCEEAISKLDQDKQYGLDLMVEETLQEGEVSKPSWEASEVVDESGSHPLHDKEHICCRSLAQISDAGSAVQSTKPRHTDQLAVQFTDSGTQCELLTQVLDARQFTDSGTQCELLIVDASESQPLHEVDHYIQRPEAYFAESYAGSQAQISHYESASQSTEPGSAVQSIDTESATQFTGSGMHHAPADASESQPLHEDDYIQRPPVHFTEPHAGSFAAANGDHISAGFMASLKEREHQNADHLSHVFPLSNKTDPPAAEHAHLHGQPTFSSTLSHVEQSDFLNQPATFSDPTMDKRDSDTNAPRTKRKGSCMGKVARGCLSCCTMPHTNP